MKLGFHQPLSRLYVFVKNEASCLWYWLDEKEQKQYIQQSALTGVLIRFEVKQVKTSFGNEEKADFEILADRPYVLRSGIDTAFTKGMLMLIAALSDEDLKRPITLELKAGSDKGNVLVSGRNPETFDFIRTGSWECVDWDGLLENAIARLGSSSQPQSQTISQEQYSDLLIRMKQCGYTMSGFSELLAKYGCSRGSDISQSVFQQLWAESGDRNQAQLMNCRAESEIHH